MAKTFLRSSAHDRRYAGRMSGWAYDGGGGGGTRNRRGQISRGRDGGRIEGTGESLGGDHGEGRDWNRGDDGAAIASVGGEDAVVASEMNAGRRDERGKCAEELEKET